MDRRRTTALILLTALAFGRAAAQDRLFVEASTDEAIGEHLVFRLREALSASHSLGLTDRRDEAIMILRIGTIEIGDRHIQIGYALTFTSNNDYFIQTVPGFCGREAVNQCVEAILSRASSLLAQIRAAAPAK